MLKYFYYTPGVKMTKCYHEWPRYELDRNYYLSYSKIRHFRKCLLCGEKQIQGEKPVVKHYILTNNNGADVNLARYLMIDDERDWETIGVNTSFDGEYIIARTFDDGVWQLENNGPFEILFLDHDLGDVSDRKNGYEVICNIESNIRLAPNEIICVSANPIGRAKINQAIENIKRMRGL